MDTILQRTLRELGALLPKLSSLSPQIARVGEAMMSAWDRPGGKVLIAGNGGSAADAMHFAEELVVRFQKNRRALPAMALCDPTILTCAANDLGYDSVFERQLDAFGNAGDVFIALTTSGNSANILRAIDRAKSRGLITIAFLGKDGGKAKGKCDIEVLVPCDSTARVQEAHKVIYHVICEWIEGKLE